MVLNTGLDSSTGSAEPCMLPVDPGLYNSMRNVDSSCTYWVSEREGN